MPRSSMPAAPWTSQVAKADRRRASDAEIVLGIARGEVWAADELYDRVQPVVDRTLRRILRSTGPDYDDLVQTTFERIVVVLSERALGSPCDLPAWSAAVATHIGLDALRRRIREQRLFRVDADIVSERSAGATLERRLEARSEFSRIQRVLAKMKGNHSETLILHDVLGHDLNEVASITGVSVAAAQSRLVRARKELLRRARGEAGR